MVIGFVTESPELMLVGLSSMMLILELAWNGNKQDYQWEIDGATAIDLLAAEVQAKVEEPVGGLVYMMNWKYIYNGVQGSSFLAAEWPFSL